MMNDPIADMLTRIRNALMVKKSRVVVPFSKIKWNIAKILKEQGYISDFQKVSGDHVSKSVGFDHISLGLSYREKHESTIKHLRRVSTPGRRVYVQKDILPIVLNHLGIAIISTPRGLMTNKQARKEGLGGEVICEIY